MFIPSTFKRPVSSWKALNLRKTLLMASSVRLKPLNCSRLPCVYAQETLTFLLRSEERRVGKECRDGWGPLSLDDRTIADGVSETSPVSFQTGLAEPSGRRV